MKADDVMDDDLDFVPKGNERWNDIDPPEIEWDEDEVTSLVDSIKEVQYGYT